MRVVVDTNVLVSFLTGGNIRQQDLADELFKSASEGEFKAVIPQFVLFELAFVMRSVYEVAPRTISEDLETIATLPGARVVDECPWSTVLGLWRSKLDSLADAALVAIAVANRFEKVATFDRKLVRKLPKLGLSSYW